MPKKNETLFVIFASPQQLAGGNLYISWKGESTGSKSEAAFFYGHEAAKEWANDNNISLTGEIPYIGQVEFSEHDISLNYARKK